MSKKIPISVHILTFNSEKTVEKALQSVQECAEILVIDGGSTDATVEIAKRYNATVMQQPVAGEIQDFSAVRNFGLQHAKYNWVFAMDSDEYANVQLIQALRNAVQDAPAAYYVTRKYVLNSTVIEHASTYPNKRIYFFHRDAIHKWIKPVHERPELQNSTPVYNLDGACLAPIGSPEEYKRKNRRYLQLEIEKSKNKGWKHWLVHRVLHTVRSRIILTIRLAYIWLLPHKGARMPIQQELLRYWYGWQLIVKTCPIWPTSQPK